LEVEMTDPLQRDPSDGIARSLGRFSIAAGRKDIEDPKARDGARRSVIGLARLGTAAQKRCQASQKSKQAHDAWHAQDE
jgi:hypothetical protein